MGKLMQIFTGNKVIINGHEFNGSVDIIARGEDGREIDLTPEIEINVTVEGDAGQVSTVSGDIQVKGGAQSVSSVSGDVAVCGDCTGKISSISGDVHVGKGYHITTVSGRIKDAN